MKRIITLIALVLLLLPALASAQSYQAQPSPTPAPQQYAWNIVVVGGGSETGPTPTPTATPTATPSGIPSLNDYPEDFEDDDSGNCAALADYVSDNPPCNPDDTTATPPQGSQQVRIGGDTTSELVLGIDESDVIWICWDMRIVAEDTDDNSIMEAKRTVSGRHEIIMDVSEDTLDLLCNGETLDDDFYAYDNAYHRYCMFADAPNSHTKVWVDTAISETPTGECNRATDRSGLLLIEYKIDEGTLDVDDINVWTSEPDAWQTKME